MKTGIQSNRAAPQKISLFIWQLLMINGTWLVLLLVLVVHRCILYLSLLFDYRSNYKLYGLYGYYLHITF